MQIAILTAVLAAIAAAESGGGPVAGVAWRLFVVISATLVAPLAALVGTQRLAGTVRLDDESEDAISRLQSAITCLWLAAVGTILVIGQWPRIVRANWHLATWPLVDELAILLPVLSPLVLIWAAMYRLERETQVAAYRARELNPPPARLGAYLLMQMRHHLGLVLVPPLAIVGLLETLAACGLSAANFHAAWWMAIPLIGTVLVFMPVAVRRIWRTSPLAAGDLRRTLDGVCRGRKCLVRDILIWDTDRSMANAAVVGISRWLRYVLLSDVLLSRLSDRQIAAVLRHELAHLRRWHLPLRLALLLLPVAWWLALQSAFPAAFDGAEDMLQSSGIRPQLAAALILPVGMLAYALVVVGWYSRMLEHDADLDASQNDHDGMLDSSLAEDFSIALETLCAGIREGRFSQWLHPPAADRIALIRRFVDSPGEAKAFRRRLVLVAAGIALLYGVAGILASL
jgi:STE24 endopeptidase